MKRQPLTVCVTFAIVALCVGELAILVGTGRAGAQSTDHRQLAAP